jgi:GxxExxY protein
MEVELELRKCDVQPQARVPLTYKGVPLGADLVMDLYFPDKLVVELKTVDKLHPVHEAQLLSYLKLSKTRIGLLVNFNVPCLSRASKEWPCDSFAPCLCASVVRNVFLRIS